MKRLQLLLAVVIAPRPVTALDNGLGQKTDDDAAMRPWMNASLPRVQRLKDLVGSMTTAEKLTQLVHKAPGVARIGLPAYVYSGT